MSMSEKRGNDTEPKVERHIDQKSKADIGKDHFGTHSDQSIHHKNMQDNGNLDGTRDAFRKKQD